MKWLQMVFPIALAGQLAIHAAADGDKAQPKATPQAWHSSEPSDNVVLTLPGAPAPPKPVAVPASVPSQPAPPAPAPTPAPARVPVSAPGKPVEAAVRREPPKPPVEPETHAIAKSPKPAGTPKPVLTPDLPALPPGFAKDSAIFCQKQIGHWKAADARSLMGEPLRQRLAYGDDKKTANGRIYAFSDPSGRYRELELDFDKSTGNLRTVFSYPPKMSWAECLRLWGNKVAAADARQGRTFYSYLDRRLDVLVDQKGNVISLGLY